MASHFTASADGRFDGPGLNLRCALGKNGVTAAAQKREGDGASPAGRWPARRVWYRPDREDVPQTGLPVIAIRPADGWSDDPRETTYNRPVTLPCRGSHERLWREDGLYDLIVELGYNDDPPEAGRGSAIFLHVARPGLAPTEGCIALAADDLRAVLKLLGGGSLIEIRG